MDIFIIVQLLFTVELVWALKITTKGPLCGRGDNPPCSCSCRANKEKPTFKDCIDVDGQSGVYLLNPVGVDRPFEVFCDMETDGGGWAVFQRRKDGSEIFYRGWGDYENGFGSLTGEFWLGNSKIHNITRQGIYELRIDMGDFEGNTAYAHYSGFSLGGTSTEYMLNVNGYTGTAGDSLAHYHNGYGFSTFDNNNAETDWESNCAVRFKGAWWYNSCYYSNLNGLYHSDSYAPDHDGIAWHDWKGTRYSLKTTEIKIRRLLA